jgi:hypothetical protein
MVALGCDEANSDSETGCDKANRAQGGAYSIPSCSNPPRLDGIGDRDDEMNHHVDICRHFGRCDACGCGRWGGACGEVGSRVAPRNRGRYRGAASMKVFHEHDIRFVEIVLHVYERMAVGS